MMGRSNKDVHPFDDAVVVEAAAKKADAALFALASHTKKRPSTLTFGRLFDGSLLDMVEVHIVEGRSIRDIGAVPCGVGIKPAFAFLGDLWEEKEDFRMFKNILLDFYRGSELDEADLHGMETYISVTAVRGSDSSGETNGDVADHVLFRVYRINMISKPGARVPDTVLTEMGPRLDMRIGRTRPANPDVMKEALRKVRDLEPRTKKNVIKNVIGDTFGRVHVGDQKLASLQARKLKGLKPSVSEEVADLQD